MDKDQLIHEIGKTIIQDIGGHNPNWTHLVMVGTIEDGSSKMSGFVYLKDGKYEPVSPSGFATAELLEELRTEMAKDDHKAPWRTALIQIDRNTGEIKFDFEYDRADRWAINLRNSSARAAELKPSET
jgi:hypothetical protein